MWQAWIYFTRFIWVLMPIMTRKAGLTGINGLGTMFCVLRRQKVSGGRVIKMTRDLRKYARQTNIRLVVGFVVLLFLVGDGLIYWIYGREAALLGLTCMLIGLAPVALIGLALWGMEWMVRRTKEDD